MSQLARLSIVPAFAPLWCNPCCKILEPVADEGGDTPHSNVKLRLLSQLSKPETELAPVAGSSLVEDRVKLDRKPAVELAGGEHDLQPGGSGPYDRIDSLPPVDASDLQRALAALNPTSDPATYRDLPEPPLFDSLLDEDDWLTLVILSDET